MIAVKALEGATAIKLLAVVVAALLWLSVIMERPGQTRLLVPVRKIDTPAGVALAAPPRNVEAVVAGPRILLLLLPWREVSCDIYLGGATFGTRNVTQRELAFNLPDGELKVVQVLPVSVNVAPAQVPVR